MPFFWVDDWAEKGFFYSVNVLNDRFRRLRTAKIEPEQTSKKSQKLSLPPIESCLGNADCSTPI